MPEIHPSTVKARAAILAELRANLAIPRKELAYRVGESQVTHNLSRYRGTTAAFEFIKSRGLVEEFLTFNETRYKRGRNERPRK